jgi:hypothetical protein
VKKVSDSNLMQIVDDDLLDLVAGDGAPGPIDGPLGHDDDVQTLASLPGTNIMIF